MTEQEQEKIIDKIRKLLALAEEDSNATQAEAENAAAKVQILLQKYNLERSQIGESKKHNLIMETLVLPSSRLWAKHLLDVVAKMNFCKAIWYIGTTKGILIGEEANIQAVTALYEYIAGALRKMATTAYAEHTRLNPYSYLAPNSFRTNFYLGAINMIHYRLYQQQKEFMESASDSRALVVVNDEQLKAFASEKFPKTKNVKDMHKQHSQVSTDGYSEGLVAGSNIELNKLVK